MKQWVLVMCLLFAVSTHTLGAQASSVEDLERRLRDLERKLSEIQSSQSSPALDEIKRQIDILTREIESLKIDRKVPLADQPQHGLGAAASKVYRAEQGLSIGGYGEFLYENFDREREDELASGKKDQLDALRAILYTGYKFNDRVLFNSEIEVEHGTTAGGIGEVSLEFGYLDFMIRPELNVRAGMMLVPSGLVNELHEPTAFLGAKRPDVERTVIPSTWRENGAGVFGDIGPVTYRAYLMTGLESRGFSSTGIRSGRQQGAKAVAEDFAIVARADWNIVEGIRLGGSAYRGDSGQGRTTPGGASFDGTVEIFELHVDANVRGFLARAIWVDGSIGDVDAINRANGLTGNKSVGEGFGGGYGEFGYDLATLIPLGDDALIPFVRCEWYDTQDGVPPGYSKNPEREVRVTTAGIDWKPIPQAVIKLELQKYENEANTGVDQWNIALGYIF